MQQLDPARVHPAMADLVARLTDLGARRVILFGSRARGDHMTRADIDLAVDAPGLESRAWAEMLEAAENAATLLQIDLVRLQDMDETMKANILKDGKILQ